MIGFALRNYNAGAHKPNQPLALQRSDEKVIEITEFPNKPFEVAT